MKQAPIPKNESKRLASLYKLKLLDTLPEERFDLITRAATRIFQVPISTLTLVDAKREWFKSCQGLSVREGSRAISFCGHALLSRNILIIPDTKKDSRFLDNPMVVGAPYIRFYAGVPVMSRDGQRIGVFCVKDIKPRNFSPEDVEILSGLADWAEGEINTRNLNITVKDDLQLQGNLKVKTRELEKINKSRGESEKAMLNVMEDLSSAKAVIEIEKAKDEAMLASIGEGMIAVDNQGKVIMLNAVAEEMLGWKIKALKDKPITTLRLEDEEGILVPLAKRPTTLALSTRKTVKVTYYFVRKDKTRFPMTVTATPIKLGGETIGLIEILRDITHEIEVDRAKSEFVSLASHQLRTPLGIIKWYLEALENEEYLSHAPDLVHRYFEEIYKSNERVLSLVRDLLSVSRIEQGRVNDAPSLVDLIKIIQEVVEQLQMLAHKKKITLKLSVKEYKLPLINIDALRFHEVIENLVGNAIEYTLPGGSVEVCLHQVDGVFLISVKDTGMGISVSDKKKIFTKFFRSAKAIAHNPEGTGLGLYVVKSYVEGWGGTVDVESYEGKGSTFTISLPITHNKTV